MFLVSWMGAARDASTGPRTALVARKITVSDIENQGRGICAADRIYPGEEIIKIPHSYLLNKHTVIKHILHYNRSVVLADAYANVVLPHDMEGDRLTKIYGAMALAEVLSLTSFQLVSLYICVERLRKSSFWQPFLDSLPEAASFGLTPLAWMVLREKRASELIDLLPPWTKKHCNKVHERFKNDHEAVKKYLATCVQRTGATEEETARLVAEILSSETYLWVWLCINSRCLYMELAESNDKAENFTMAPYVDFINHSDTDHCTIKVDGRGFHVKTTCAYNEGDQLYLSYGPHSNDFLLCEYGFTIPENRWNELQVDEVILKTLNDNQKEYLKKHNYYGDYTISKHGGPSFRTAVALAVMQVPTPQESQRLTAFVNGYTDGETFARGNKLLLKTILEKYRQKCHEGLRLADAVDEDPAVQNIKRTIGGLYRDVESIIKTTLE